MTNSDLNCKCVALSCVQYLERSGTLGQYQRQRMYWVAVKPLYLPAILGSRNFRAEGGLCVSACLIAHNGCFLPELCNSFSYWVILPACTIIAVIHSSKKYNCLFISDLLLAFIWCFLYLLLWKWWKIISSCSHAPLLMAAEIPALLPAIGSLLHWTAAGCFVSLCEVLSHHCCCWVSLFFFLCIILTLPSSLCEGMARAAGGIPEH